MPMPLYAFFDEYDFSGKTVIPFCTHGGSRFSSAIKTIRELEKGATVLDGYAIARDRVPESKDGVLKWLEKIGMKKCSRYPFPMNVLSLFPKIVYKFCSIVGYCIE